jgi:hypothetical protein
VAHIEEDLSQRIRSLQKEIHTTLEEKEKAFRYQWHKGKARFESGVLSDHQKLKQGLAGYLLGSRLLAVLTAPIIYLGIIPFGFLDLFLILYQGICFPVYGIPKVRRSEYLIFDRSRLKYINILERFNCWYCSYGNGLFAYATEVAARTEQQWCPIKHATRVRSPHSRYPHFLDYGDAQGYRQRVETVRHDFVDVRDLASAPSDKHAN